MKINSFKEEQHAYLIRSLSYKAIKGTVVNQALQSLHGGSLIITVTLV